MTDFLAPGCEVSVDGAPLAPALATQLAEVVVVNEPDLVDCFSLTFANPFPDLPFTHGAAKARFPEGSNVSVKLGYVGALETVGAGDVTAIGARFASDRDPVVRVEGISPLHRLRGTVKTRTFKEMTDSDVARQILADSGLRVTVETTDVKHPYLIQYNQTDLAFVGERARRLRFVLAYEDGGVAFRSAKESESRALLLVWGNPTLAHDPGAQTYPLLSFEPTLRATRPVTKVVVRGLDPLTREPILGTAAAAKESTGGAKAGPATRRRARGDPADATVVDVPVVSVAEADQIAQAIFDRLAMQFVTGSGTALGLPGLRAGRVVELQGIGSFNGRYYVTRATHTYSARGYMTSFSVRSDSVA